MMDFLKVFLEEPDRVKKIILFLLRIVMNVIFGAFLYSKIIGSYEIIDLTNFNKWAEFILSGNVLICFLCYLGSEVILFQLTDVITVIPLLLLSKWISNQKKVKVPMKEISFELFKFFEIVKFNDTLNKYVAGKNLIYADEFISDIKNSGGLELKKITSSLLNEVFHYFCVLCFLYFCIPLDFSINAYIFLIFVFIVGIYLIYSLIFRHILNNIDNYQFAIHKYSYENKVLEFIIFNFLTYTIHSERRRNFPVFEYNGKQYLVIFDYKKGVGKFEIEHAEMLIFLKKNELNILFISNQDNNEKIIFDNILKERLFIILFKKEEELLNKLNVFFSMIDN